MKILIVDDSKAMRTIMTKAMKSVGYPKDEYLYAGDGEEAFDIARSEKPELILSDLHMPKISGIELISKIKQQSDLDCKIGIVSIDDSESNLQKIKSVGADFFLKKPFTTGQLLQTMAGVIAHKMVKRKGSLEDCLRVIPRVDRVQRILSDLSAREATLVETTVDKFDLSNTPYMGCSMVDENKEPIVSIFMDILAINTVAALMARGSLDKALNDSVAHHLEDSAKEALESFLRVFSAISTPPGGGQLLYIPSFHYYSEPASDTYQYVKNRENDSVVLALSCAPCDGGIFFISPL